MTLQILRFEKNLQIETFLQISSSVASSANQNKWTAELPFPLFTH